MMNGNHTRCHMWHLYQQVSGIANSVGCVHMVVFAELWIFHEVNKSDGHNNSITGCIH